MNKYEQSLNALDKLLANTSPEEILSIYNSINGVGFSGPTIKEYFDGCGMNINFTIPENLTLLADESAFKPPSMNYKIPEDTTPNFSGYFFM